MRKSALWMLLGSVFFIGLNLWLRPNYPFLETIAIIIAILLQIAAFVYLMKSAFFNKNKKS